ncbi:hypothetical protein F4778DRAFT_730423 [Xylariomycetidae sp. FL2044]|nr:hypothetical protein F4778DRAFT_730423 [Xylariomycetidae sp. FL2044]
MAANGTLSSVPNIPPAKIRDVKVYKDTGDDPQGPFLIRDLRFECPIDYRDNTREADNMLELSLKLVYGYETRQGGSEIIMTKENLASILSQQKLLVYLCGGPGDRNPPLRNRQLNHFLLARGYWILYPDYRGTGDSTAVTPDTSPKLLRRLLPRLRQTDIVRDLEAVHRRLFSLSSPSSFFSSSNHKIRLHNSQVRDGDNAREGKEAAAARNRKWTLLGQSFGGWISLTYLSFYPGSLAQILLAGGLAPITCAGPEPVYQRLFARAAERNENYYARYPKDVAGIRAIVRFLAAREAAGRPVELPAGGLLTARRFLCIGRFLGREASFSGVHDLVSAMVLDLESHSSLVCGCGSPCQYGGDLTTSTLREYEDLDNWRLDARPLFAIVHEAMYCGVAGAVSNWAAQAVARTLPRFWWVGCDDPRDIIEGIDGAVGGGSRDKIFGATTIPDAAKSRDREDSEYCSVPGAISLESASTSSASDGGEDYSETDAGADTDDTSLASSLSAGDVELSSAPSVQDDVPSPEVNHEDPGTSHLLPHSPHGDERQQKPIYFSGEMVYPFHFSTYATLTHFRDEAQRLASHEWDEPLYDHESLRRNCREVPVTALSYRKDMYVDFELAMETGAILKSGGGVNPLGSGIDEGDNERCDEKVLGEYGDRGNVSIVRILEDEEREHGAIRDDTLAVLERLWGEETG